jgi:ferritin-like protein
VIGIAACVGIGAMSLHSTSKIYETQTDIDHIVDIQDQIESLFANLVRFSERQVEIYNTSDFDSLKQIESRHELEQSFSQTLERLENLLVNRPETLAGVTEAGKSYQSYLDSDHLLLEDTALIITADKNAKQASVKVQKSIHQIIELAEKISVDLSETNQTRRDEIVKGLSDQTAVAVVQRNEAINAFFAGQGFAVLSLIKKYNWILGR